MKSKLAVASYLSVVAWVGLSACGSSPGGSSRGGKVEPSAQQTATPKPQEEPAPSSEESTVNSLGLDSIELSELSLDLVGDVRVGQVLRDGAGNIYAALQLVQADSVEGYTLIKLDPSGKELWRFPTKAAAEATPDATRSFRQGSFIQMQLRPDGKLMVMALVHNAKDFGARFSPYTERNELPDVTANGVTLLNVTEMSTIDASGIGADSPSLDKVQYLVSAAGDATRGNVLINGFSLLPEGKILLEASSRFGASTFQMKQVVSANFRTTHEYACFVSPRDSLALGVDAAVVVKQSSLLDENVDGNCWDLLATERAKQSEKFHLYKPAKLESGAEVWEAESLADLLRGQNNFEAKKVRPLKGSPADLASLVALPLTARIGSLHFAQMSVGFTPLYAGQVEVGDDGERGFALVNQVAVEGERWQVNLPTSPLRFPESMSMDLTDDKDRVVVGWTDLFPQGETGAGTRAVRVAMLDLKSPTAASLKSRSFVVPPESGLSTFTSVAFSAQKGGLAILGTAVAKGAPAASLLIGLSK